MTDKKISELDLTVVVSGLDLIATATDIPGTPETEAITFANLIGSAESLLETAFTGKKTVYMPVSAMSPTTTNGCAAVAQTELTAGQPEVVHMAFDGTAVENALFSWSFPKSWDKDKITFQAYWTGLVGGAGGVLWRMGAIAVGNDDPIDVAYVTNVEVVDTFILAEDLHISGESDPLTVDGNPVQGDMVYFIIQRDPTHASDTRTQDANLIGIKIFYTIDKLKDD